MRKHLNSWEQLANDPLGLELQREDIFFVCGVTKTSRWGVSAFCGTQRGAQGTISCDFGALGSANMRINIAETTLPGGWYRTGPPSTRGDPARNFAPAPAAMPHTLHGALPTRVPFETSSSTSVSSYGTAAVAPTISSSVHDSQWGPAMSVPVVPQAALGVPEKMDQCIFFHYYKAKRRFFFLERIEAGAGPHELPPKADDDFATSALLAQGEGNADHMEFDMPTGQFSMVCTHSLELDAHMLTKSALRSREGCLGLYTGNRKQHTSY